jgi:quinohemoprotein ethanol dehydrogenase
VNAREPSVPLPGKAPLPQFVKYSLGKLISGIKYDPADVKEGTLLYVSNCVFCHGVPGVSRGGNVHNLGYVPAEEIEHLDEIVFKGPYMSAACRISRIV